MNNPIKLFLHLTRSATLCLALICSLTLAASSRRAYGATISTSGVARFVPPDYQAKGKSKGSAAGQDAGNKGSDSGTGSGDKGAGSGEATGMKPAPKSGSIQFVDLVLPADQKKPKLPYGQPFTISGKLSDVCIVGSAKKGEHGIDCKTTDSKGNEIEGGGIL